MQAEGCVDDKPWASDQQSFFAGASTRVVLGSLIGDSAQYTSRYCLTHQVKWPRPKGVRCVWACGVSVTPTLARSLCSSTTPHPQPCSVYPCYGYWLSVSDETDGRKVSKETGRA